MRCCAQEVRKLIAILAFLTIPNARFHRDSWLVRWLVGFYLSFSDLPSRMLLCKVFQGGGSLSCFFLPYSREQRMAHHGSGRLWRDREERFPQGDVTEWQKGALARGTGTREKSYW